jgi:hypothetical protein
MNLQALTDAIERAKGIVTILISLQPILDQAITATESLFPTAGSGPSKLEIVKAHMKAAFDAVALGFATFDQVWPYFAQIAGIIVSVRNSTGAFQRGTPAAPPVTIPGG